MTALPGVWIVAGNSHKTQIPELRQTVRRIHRESPEARILAAISSGARCA